MSVSVAQLMQDHPYLKLLPSNRIKCDVTGHELPLRPDVIQSHVNGKKFKKSLEWYNYDYTEFLPHIVPHKRDSKKLFCLLTKQELNKVPEEVKKHVQGRRFERLKKEKVKKDSKTKLKKVEEDEKPDFWMPESEEGESEEEEEEDDVDSVGDLVSDDDEEAGEEDAEEIEDGEDLAGSKRKQVKDISKSRKVIKVDGDFQLIKKVNKKGKPKGMK